MLDETVQSQAAGVDGKQHWLLLLDLAPVHAFGATVGELRKRAWIHTVYVPAGATSYLQQCDRFYMRPIKHRLSIACAKYFAQSLLVQWLGEAIKRAERQSIVDHAWSWLCEEEQHMALAAAWEMQDN
eukprot:1082312-Amphidinium_carterae.2